jgi:hypothetical protein
MPLVRYFLFTSGILLGLLLWADWYFPKLTEAAAADVNRTIIRIHSTRIWPAAVRFDTSVPMPRFAPVAMAEEEMPAPALAPEKPTRQAYAHDAPPAAKAPERPRRHVNPPSKVSTRETQRRLASYQSNWFPTGVFR